MKYYSHFLKFEAQVFLGIFFVGYLLKWGVAWHDAGDVMSFGNVKFSAYWDMILIIYTGFGFYLFQASFDPDKFRPFLSFGMWIANFAHGVVAFAHCFDKQDSGSTPTSTPPSMKYGLGSRNMDKMLLAVPLWFGMWSLNLLFAKKAFGTFLLPWDRESMFCPVPQAYENDPSTESATKADLMKGDPELGTANAAAAPAPPVDT